MGKKEKSSKCEGDNKDDKNSLQKQQSVRRTRDKVGGNNSSLEVGWRTSRKVEKDTNRTTVEQHECKNKDGDDKSVYDREKSN